MAETFPMAASFFGGLPVASAQFDLTEALQSSGRTAGGSLLTAGYGSRLWRGRVVLDRMLFARAEAVKSKLSVLREPGRFLFVCPIPVAEPSDRTPIPGPVTISALGATPRELRLTGLPVGFRLRAGEPLAFQYGSNPTRYAYHRIVTDEAVAGPAGQTPLIEVTPPLRPGVVVGAVVTLKNPYFKAAIIPGSTDTGTASGRFQTGVAFDVLQTLR